PYDGEIAYADSQVARVLDRLRTRGLLARTLVVVAGDHGEGLGDHGERTHGMLVYDSTLRVPLIVTAPGHPAGTRNEAVSLVDLAPTLLRAAGITPPAAMPGRNLLEARGPAARGEGDRDLYSESEYPRVAGWSPLQALTDGRWMTIRAGAATEMYDLQSDPRQEHDLGSTRSTAAAAMAARAEAIHASAVPSGTQNISADARERLRSLGYVASSPPAGSPSNAANPSARIASWNEFEGALAELTSDPADAEAKLRRLAAENPDAPVIQTTYARALKEIGRLDAALTVYRQAARRWPTDAVLLHDLAVTARDAAGMAKGPGATALHDEAVRADQAALTLAPDSAAALNGAGLLAIDDGHVAQAVKAFERAASLDSSNASYWANLGNARRAAGDRAGAEQAYRRSLDLDARTADAANGLGVLLVEMKRPAEAARWFQRAIADAPDLIEARLNLGIALQETGDRAGAAAEYRRVLGAGGNHPREKDAAGKLLAAVGRGR
ncbi:MAG: sulfatase-like hydrolase/transferase, partial [Vicinamibacterales bacterium]